MDFIFEEEETFLELVFFMSLYFNAGLGAKEVFPKSGDGFLEFMGDVGIRGN